MPTFTLRRFSCPETLKAIVPVRLLAFLKPYGQFFLSRGVTLPKSATDGKLDYEELARVFMTPDGKTPKELIDALYFVDEMATPEGMDALLAEAKQQKLKLAARSDYSPADIAVQIWLLNKEILERKHAEHYIAKVRSFEYHQMDRFRRPTFKRPSDKQLAALASDLDDWFEEKKRGRGTRIIMCEKEDGVWFLVRHGDPYKREESIDGGSASSVHYRPIKYDVVAYAPQIGELRINARSKGEAAVRSWPPVMPRCLRWAFPVWLPADDLDPTLLRSEQPKRTRQEERQPEWDVERFMSTFVGAEPKLVDALLVEANRQGVNDFKCRTLLRKAEAVGLVYRWDMGRGRLGYATQAPPHEQAVEDAGAPNAKRLSVETLLIQCPELSSTDVAARCGVTERYVRKLRARLLEGGSEHRRGTAEQGAKKPGTGGTVPQGVPHAVPLATT